VTYVIAEPCIGEKNGACVDVCPAGCIHTTPDAPQNYIDPAVCIECEQCVLVCPVDAVFLDKDLPEEWRPFETINAAFFQANKPVGSLQVEEATRMVEAVTHFASRAGLTVAVVVLDRSGSSLAVSESDPHVVDAALKKAYTALMYGVATHELKAGSRPLWRQVSEIDAERVLLTPGGYPIIEAVETLGAVGVAGGSAPQDMLCCQAAIGARLAAHAHK
jgi:ferredoxin